MNKLLAVVVAVMFAAGSVTAFAASHAGAAMKDDKKTEGKMEKKKGEGKKKAGKKKGADKMEKSADKK